MGHVRRHSQDRPAAQHVAGKAAQIAARPDFQEHPDAVLVHGLQRARELHAPRPLVHGQPAHRVHLRRHLGRGGTGIDGQARRFHVNALVQVRDRAHVGLEEPRMIRPGKGQRLAEHALALEPAAQRVDRLGPAAHDGLVRAVVHGHPGLRLGFTQQAFHALGAGGRGQQGPACQASFDLLATEHVGRGEQFVQKPVVVHDGSGRGQGRKLARAVSQHGVRLQLHPQQDQIHRPIGDQHRGHRPVDAQHLLGGLVAQLLRTIVGQQERAAGRRLARAGFEEHAVAAVEMRAHLGEMGLQVGQHVHIGRAFAGKQRGQAPRLVQRPLGEIDALRVVNLPALRVVQALKRLGQARAKLPGGTGHHGQAHPFGRPLGGCAAV